MADTKNPPLSNTRPPFEYLLTFIMVTLAQAAIVYPKQKGYSMKLYVYVWVVEQCQRGIVCVISVKADIRGR